MNLFYPSYARRLIEKQLCIGYLPFSGRNNIGKICVRHKGGGSKRRIQFIDLYRRVNSFGWVVKIFKTAFRTAFIALMIYKNGLSSYISLTQNIKIGDYIYTGSLLVQKCVVGNGITLPISYMNLFSIVSNLEVKPFTGIKLIRSAGMGAMIITKSLNYVTIKLNNGLNLSLSDLCICSLGLVSNSLHKSFNHRKAGHKRALGIRPTVRGVAMNPHDHPHGGGEGKKSPSVTARSP